MEKIFIARSVKANRGDLASQLGIVEGLLRNSYVSKIFVSSYYHHHFEGNNRVSLVKPSVLRGYLKTKEENAIIKNCTNIFWGGGVDLQDSSSKIKMLVILLRFILIKKHRIKLVMAFQGIGPIYSKFGFFVFNMIAKMIDYAIVREPTAVNYLKGSKKMKDSHIKLSCDGAYLLDCPKSIEGLRYLNKKNLNTNKPILGINLRRWFHHGGGFLPKGQLGHRNTDIDDKQEQLINNLASAIIASNYYDQVALVPMYRRLPEPWEDDIRFLERLKDCLPYNYKTVLLEEDLSVKELLCIYTNFRVMIGVRLHSTILAHIAGVPTLHIYYEHKGAECFKSMNMEEYLIDIETACMSSSQPLILSKIISIEQNYDILANNIKQRVSGLKKAAQNQLNEYLQDL